VQPREKEAVAKCFASRPLTLEYRLCGLDSGAVVRHYEVVPACVTFRDRRLD